MIAREAEEKREVDVKELQKIHLNIRELVSESLQALKEFENQKVSYQVTISELFGSFFFARKKLIGFLSSMFFSFQVKKEFERTIPRNGFKPQPLQVRFQTFHFRPVVVFSSPLAGRWSN